MAVTAKVTIIGQEEVLKFTRKLAVEGQTALDSAIDEIARWVQKSARLRARIRRWAATGKMAKGISVRRIGKKRIHLEARSREAPFQEFGFRPHWIHISMLPPIVQERLYPIVRRRGFLFVKQSKPFIRPALKAVIPRIPDICRKHLRRVIK